MRHRHKTQNLSRFSTYFKATIRSIARSVIIHQRIMTTLVRAKLTRQLVDRLITLGKDNDSLAARRRAFAVLGDHALVKKLFSEIAPMFTEKKGGYTRIIPYKRRRGDNAEMVILELSVQKVVVSKPAKEKKAKEVKETDERIKMVSKQAQAKEAVKEAQEKEAPKKPEHKKEKETKKPSKKMMGGFGKFFKSERDSL